MNLVAREKDQTDIDEMPLTSFLFSYIKKVNKSNEKDKFDYADWVLFIDTMDIVAKHPTLKHIEFESSPDE